MKTFLMYSTPTVALTHVRRVHHRGLASWVRTPPVLLSSSMGSSRLLTTFFYKHVSVTHQSPNQPPTPHWPRPGKPFATGKFCRSTPDSFPSHGWNHTYCAWHVVTNRPLPPGNTRRRASRGENRGNKTCFALGANPQRGKGTGHVSDMRSYHDDDVAPASNPQGSKHLVAAYLGMTCRVHEIHIHDT